MARVLWSQGLTPLATVCRRSAAQQSSGTFARQIREREAVPMRLSARNVLKGTVKQIQPEMVNSEIVVELPGGQEIVSIITKTSAENLGLREGGKGLCRRKGQQRDARRRLAGPLRERNGPPRRPPPHCCWFRRTLGVRPRNPAAGARRCGRQPAAGPGLCRREHRQRHRRNQGSVPEAVGQSWSGPVTRHLPRWPSRSKTEPTPTSSSRPTRHGPIRLRRNRW